MDSTIEKEEFFKEIKRVSDKFELNIDDEWLDELYNWTVHDEIRAIYNWYVYTGEKPAKEVLQRLLEKVKSK